MACGQRRVDSKNSQTTPATTSTSSIRQFLGAADTQTAPCHIQHSPNTPTTGLCERGKDTSRSTGRSGRQKAATRRNMRREERVTVQGPVKEQQPDGMSHKGGGGGAVSAHPAPPEVELCKSGLQRRLLAVGERVQDLCWRLQSCWRVFGGGGQKRVGWG